MEHDLKTRLGTRLENDLEHDLEHDLGAIWNTIWERFGSDLGASVLCFQMLIASPRYYTMSLERLAGIGTYLSLRIY